MTEEETRLLAAIDNPRFERCGISRTDSAVYVSVSGPRLARVRLADMEAVSEFFSTPNVNAVSGDGVTFEVLPP